MKSKREKLIEYEDKYGNIPKDYIKRLEWLYDTLNIDDEKSDEILKARQDMINSTYYKTLRMILYEIPENTPRPRANLIHKSDVINSVTGGNDFIHIYSITGRENKEYMRAYTKSNLQELEHLLCTPCDLELRAYFPTPKHYTKVQTFLAEIGLERPISKPDFDNIEKAYGDMFTDNIWIDDIVVVDATFRKYYSVLPRVEIDLMYSNQLYNKRQYKGMISRKSFTDEMSVSYFGG